MVERDVSTRRLGDTGSQPNSPEGCWGWGKLIHLSVDGQVEAPSPSDEISIHRRPAMWVVDGLALGLRPKA